MTHQHDPSSWDNETGWQPVPGTDDGIQEWVPLRSANGHIGWFHRHPDGSVEGNHVRRHGNRGRKCKTCGTRPPLGAFKLYVLQGFAKAGG